MDPMGISFVMAVAVLGLGLIFRKPISHRMQHNGTETEKSARVATLTIPIAMAVLILGGTATVFYNPADEFSHFTGATFGMAALINYVGSLTDGRLHNYMARTLKRTSNMYARVGESEQDYSQALYATGRIYLLVAALGAAGTVIALVQ
jgi:hypothetical protein